MSALETPDTGAVVRCADCHTPLIRVPPMDGLYCPNCKYAPSMQDTYIGES